MTFYHRTLYHASSITHAVIGNFLDEKKEDIIVSTGRIVKLLRFEVDNTSENIQTLISADTYETINSLSKFRREDETRDWIVISADSGTTSVLAVNAEKMIFEVVVQEKLKVQFQRTLPVQHLVTYSQRHAVFTAAIEEVTQLWIFHGPDYRLLKILENSEENTLIYDIAFVDINSKNIVVAFLVTAYKELHPGVKYEIRKRQKPTLIFNEVDGDKMIEISRIQCMDHANSLISVPGERGVLVCAEDYIAFYSMDSSSIVRCSIPRRLMDPKTGVIFVCSTKCISENSIYYFAQTEQGDIFKIQLVSDELGVDEIVLKYFITLPVASALCTFRSGFLFVASEFGDHHIYRIADIESRARVHPSFSSSLEIPEGKPFWFMHRILNIAPVAEIKSLSPIMHMEFEPLSSKRPRMCLALGRGALSALKISKVERDVSYQSCAKLEMKKDEVPLHMWAIKSTMSISKESETLIVVSFEDSTAVYSLERTSDYVMRKIKNTPFARNTNTLGLARTGKDAIVQVCPEGICLIRGGKNMLIYKTEENAIEECAMNKKSLVIVFKNKELKHHQIDKDGLVMKSKIPRRLIRGVRGQVTCMLLSEQSESDQLLAVGISIPPDTEESTSDNEVNLFKIGLSDIKFLGLLKIDNSPYSFLFINGVSNVQSLLVGCENGILLTLDVGETAETEGTKHELNAIKTEKIGSKAVQLLHACGKEQVGYGILAVSNHSWFKETVVGCFLQLKSDISPCMCIMPEFESVATILEDQLRVFILDLQPKPPVTIPLEYTPRKFSVDFCTGNIYIIETDDNSHTKETKEKKKKEFEMHVEAKRQQSSSNLPPLQNIPKSWASILRVINLTGVNVREVFKLPFEQNEAALSFCRFEQGGDDLLLVGVAKNFKLSSGCCAEASIYTFRILKQGETISFLHKTHVKSAPLAMCYYEGNVWIGIGRKLALFCVVPVSFDLELVCEKKDCVSSRITAIYPVDKIILVSDSEFGISYLVYLSKSNTLCLLQEDISPIEVTAASILSGKRMIRAARSRDIFIVGLGTLQNRDMSKVINDDEPPYTLSKEKVLGRFHIGEVVSSMQLFKTFPSELDTVVYTTLSGSVGILTQLPSKEDEEFLNSLNTTLRSLAQEIDAKRNTLPIFPNTKFRSFHYKHENVIDGDYLEEFLRLEVGFQEIICREMKEKDVSQISSKLEQIRRKTMLDFQF